MSFLLDENEKRFTFQLILLTVLWGAATWTFLIQMYNLPSVPLLNYTPDPYTYYPFEFNPFNNRMTLIESIVIWLGWFYGLLRIFNILRIIGEDDTASEWGCFWEMTE